MERIRLDVVSSCADAPGLRRGEPVTFGLPFPRGVVANPTDLAFLNAEGRAQPIQSRVLDRWSDGSVRWILIDSVVDRPGGPTVCWIANGAPTDGGGTARQVSVVERDGSLIVDTGAARFVCRTGGSFPFESVNDADGLNLIDSGRSGLRVESANGEACALAIDTIDVEERGPLRATIRWQGRISCGARDRWLECDARAHFFAGLPVVRMGLTIRNPHPATHPGNFWELGDQGSALLRELAIEFSVPGCGDAAVQYSLDRDSPLVPCAAPFEVYQESSGGEQWNSPVHVNRHGRVPMQLRGFRLRAGERREAGLRATPVVLVAGGGVEMAATTRDFWQNFPRSIEVRGTAITVGLWPRQFPDAHELQGGEQKTHELALAFGRDPVSDIPLDWCRTPLVIRAEPSWYAESAAVGHLVPEAADPSTAYVALVRAGMGADGFVAKRERIDEYGWRHFGDIYADHEAALGSDRLSVQPVSQPVVKPSLVSHYNNQYDAIAGFAIQFFRSGDVRWWTQMIELAAHAVDIDLYHTARDKAAYSGGAFWHTSHYTEAGRSTHRSYPRAPGATGGGPSCEHTYTAGFVLHHFLTGDPRSRDAVIQLADWVLQIEDGTRSPFRWLDRGDTGLASATRSLEYHGPGRGAANSIATLLDGYRMSGYALYLDKAEQLIRRCIHPKDDVAGRSLLNAEERWSYTIFLQVLGRYLNDAADRGTHGFMHAYARESLLNYARWMAVHEYPFLDRPELLEYPTETWAAQDMRKCEVLLQASLHAAGEHERETFRERAAFFFRSSTATLTGMATRTLARPMVILLGNGFRMAWFSSHPTASAPTPGAGTGYPFGAPSTFVPQRRRAFNRAKWIAGAAAAIGSAIILWLSFG